MNKHKTSTCQHCGQEHQLIGMGKYRKDINEWEWYQSSHSCEQGKRILSVSASALGTIGGKTTLERHGKAHFSSAGKKGMANRWGKKRSEPKENI